MTTKDRYAKPEKRTHPDKLSPRRAATILTKNKGKESLLPNVKGLLQSYNNEDRGKDTKTNGT